MDRGRPSTSGRPPTSGRPTTSGKLNLRPPTMSRPVTIVNSNVTMGPVQGLGVAPPITVADRPMTQHGLGGLKTGSKPLRRSVQDKSYFLGLIRTKIAELNRETLALNRESENLKMEQSTHKSYDQRATELAKEIKDLLVEMADYNTAADKLSTDTAVDDVRWEYQQLKQNNEIESKMNENLFAERQRKETEVQQLQMQIDQEKVASEKLITNMKPDLREKFMHLKNDLNRMKMDIENVQIQIGGLNDKKVMLEQELAGSETKQEAFNLYGKIRDLEEKYNSLLDEEKLRGTPAEEREKLLKQVKEDNLEISTMERHSKDLKDQKAKLNEAINQVDEDLESFQSERNQQYLELKKREETMNSFFSSYEENRVSDAQRTASTEEEIVKLLEKISFNVIQCQNLPMFGELQLLKDDLNMKEIDYGNSQSSTKVLLLEKHKLKEYLKKMDQLETKMTTELDDLKEKIKLMEKELTTFEDIDGLQKSFLNKESRMKADRIKFSSEMESLKVKSEQLQSDHEELKKKLDENEAHVQLGNLERKLQHLEQNNYSVNEYITKKKCETNYKNLANDVLAQFSEYNNKLISHLSSSRR